MTGKLITVEGGRGSWEDHCVYYQMVPAKGLVEFPPAPHGTPTIAVVAHLY